MKNWHTGFSDVVAEAHFRAAVTRLRYKVHYDPANRLWNLRETTTPIQDNGGASMTTGSEAGMNEEQHAPSAENDAPMAVEQGWVLSDFIDNLGGDSYRLLTYPGGVVRFEHRCDRGDRGVIVCAPALRLGNGHALTRDERGAPTVRASILCPDCGTHGFITDGRWSA